MLWGLRRPCTFLACSPRKVAFTLSATLTFAFCTPDQFGGVGRRRRLYRAAAPFGHLCQQQLGPLHPPWGQRRRSYRMPGLRGILSLAQDGGKSFLTRPARLDAAFFASCAVCGLRTPKTHRDDCFTHATIIFARLRVLLFTPIVLVETGGVCLC